MCGATARLGRGSLIPLSAPDQDLVALAGRDREVVTLRRPARRVARHLIVARGRIESRHPIDFEGRAEILEEGKAV
jgi:hypothetical protein